MDYHDETYLTCDACGAETDDQELSTAQPVEVFMTASQFLKETIDMFIEYRDKHGYSEDQAKEKAVLEMLDPDSGITINIEQKVLDAF